MKRISILLFTGLAMACTSNAQDKTDLKILFITPTKSSIDPVFAKTADSLIRALKQDMLKGSEDAKNWKNLSENDRRNGESLIRFMQKASFGKLVSEFTAEALYLHLSYGHGFKNMLMLMKDTATDNKTTLKQLAASNGISYVVSFPQVGLYSQNGEVNIKLNFQLYDASSNSILLSREYAGNEFPQISEDYCGQKTITCLLQDEATQLAADIVDALSTVHPVLIAHKRKCDRDSTLTAQREDILINKYLPRPWDGTLARSVIDPKDSSINLADMFYSFQNEEKTRFLALFARNATAAEQDKLPGDDTMPNTVAYMVRGMLYNGQWYYDKMYDNHFLGGVSVEQGRPYFFTYLKEQLEFFTEDDTTFNKNFWESGPFGKVKDITKDPQWEEMKYSWKYKEHENRDFVGMYDIIAEKLKDSVRKAREKFKVDIYEKYLKSRINKNFPPLHEDEDEQRGLLLFFTKDLSAALGAFVVTDAKGVRTMRYYVVLPRINELYEWTKLTRVLGENEYPGMIIYDQIHSLAKEEIDNDHLLEDENFWNNHVLLKENGKYKYLKPL